jgi:hypothetical protein
MGYNRNNAFQSLLQQSAKFPKIRREVSFVWSDGPGFFKARSGVVVAGIGQRGCPRHDVSAVVDLVEQLTRPFDCLRGGADVVSVQRRELRVTRQLGNLLNGHNSLNEPSAERGAKVVEMQISNARNLAGCSLGTFEIISQPEHRITGRGLKVEALEFSQQPRRDGHDPPTECLRGHCPDGYRAGTEVDVWPGKREQFTATHTSINRCDNQRSEMVPLANADSQQPPFFNLAQCPCPLGFIRFRDQRC